MIRFLPVLAGIFLATPVPNPALAGTFRLEADHTFVSFSYNHLGLSHPTGKVMGASGTLTFDASRPAESVVDVTLDMSTLSTGLPMFDKVLQGPDYFDAQHFPAASFKSTHVEVTGANSASITGDLTLHGVTKPVTLAVVFNAKKFNPALFKTGLGFSATGRIQRRDFGMDKYEPFVGDDVDLHIEAEAYPGPADP